MSTEFTIRSATRADIPSILHFIRELASYERLADQVVADEATLNESLFGERAAAEVLICEIESKPAAFAVFFQNFSTFLGRPGIYLEDLFVIPEFRRLGLGRALLKYLAALAVQRGCGRLEWAVLDWNQPAIDFYQTLGAEPMSEWTVFRLSGATLNEFAQSSG